MLYHFFFLIAEEVLQCQMIPNIYVTLMCQVPLYTLHKYCSSILWSYDYDYYLHLTDGETETLSNIKVTGLESSRARGRTKVQNQFLTAILHCLSGKGSPSFNLQPSTSRTSSILS